LCFWNEKRYIVHPIHKLGSRNVIVADGFEILTYVPFYVQDVMRLGKRMKNGKLMQMDY
jgi:hypothetical protein